MALRAIYFQAIIYGDPVAVFASKLNFRNIYLWADVAKVVPDGHVVRVGGVDDEAGLAALAVRVLSVLDLAARHVVLVLHALLVHRGLVVLALQQTCERCLTMFGEILKDTLKLSSPQIRRLICKTSVIGQVC